MSFKRLISLFTLCALFLSKGTYVQAESKTDSREENCLPQGKLVQKETNDYQAQLKRRRLKNWSLALSSVAIGVTALVLVSNNHNK